MKIAKDKVARFVVNLIKLRLDRKINTDVVSANGFLLHDYKVEEDYSDLLVPFLVRSRLLHH